MVPSEVGELGVFTVPTRLSGLDAAFLYLETPTNHMHVGGVLVLDPSTRPGGKLTREEMARFIEARLHLAAPFRRRLAWVPFNLDHPVWIEDPDFDIDLHVRRAALPSPGGMAELAEFAADVMGRPIDRNHPLWELWFVEGLKDGRVAIITKTHHAAIDGVSGAELAAAILQLTPDQEAPDPEHPWRAEREPSDLRLLIQAGVRQAATPLSVARLGRQALDSATALFKVARTRKEEPPPAPFTAPMTVINGSIGPRRTVWLDEFGLEDLKRVKNSLGGTVNDVVLAVVAGALRRYLLRQGEELDRPLVAMVPISVRADEQRGQMGNQVSAMLAALPVEEPDVIQRLRRISTSTAGAKEQHGALGANTLQQLAELAPGGVASLAARLYTRTRAADRHRPIWNLVVSNVPGPRFPLYCAGARVEGFYPLGPVHEMVGLNVTLFSYEERVFVGLNADRGLPDVASLAEGMREALQELVEVAESHRGSG